MMKRGLLFISVILFLFSCSVQKYLPEGERLYKGYTINIEKHPEVSAKTRSLKSDIGLAIKPRANKFLLGQPWKVWWWYKIGEPKHEKGLKAFFRNKLGEPPVLSSRINSGVTAENIEALMENLGYFHTTAQGDTTNSSYFTKAHYKVHVNPQYHIKNVIWVSDSSELLKILQTTQESRSIVKSGNPYRLSDITAERDRIDLFIKTKGYYFYNPDYLMVYADSTVGDRKVDMYFNIKANTPVEAKHPYTISSITVFPNYNLAVEKLDTSKSQLTVYDGLYIKDTAKKYRSDLFGRTIVYRPGEIYSSRKQNITLNRLINLPAFKFVKNRFEPVRDTNRSFLMGAYYFLTPAKKKSIQAEISGFSRENNYLGTQLGINIKNRNTFKGAELLTLRGYVGLEVSFADSLSKNNNYKLGGEATLKIPKYIIPFFTVKENNFYPPNTSILVSYELLRKQLFYTRNIFRLQYEFTWKRSISEEITWAPVSLSYLNAINVTDTFYKEVLKTPSLLLNVYNEAILGSFVSYTYNSLRSRKANKWYFNSSLDFSGNLYGLITGAKQWREKKIFNAPFAQYAKIDINATNTRELSKAFSWVNHVQLGLGIPYHNSKLLPFSKQYIIGGSSSIRGFTVRSLGPGSYKPTAQDQRFFQIIGGDYKLLLNSEIRFPLTPKVNGAIFADVGNIWTKDTILFGKAGQLSKNWYKEIAVASGLGFRFDATVILIRVDIGFPLRKPYLPENERWVLNKINLSSSTWRRQDLILNIAIGYPF